MTRPDAGAAEGFDTLLAAYDEALANGLPPPPAAADTELRARLDRARACLHRLEACWPRAAPDHLGPRFTPGLAFDAASRTTRFGRFAVRRQLGSGGGGLVFLAFDPHRNADVALKLPRPEALVTPELRRRLLREAAAAAALDHPGLVPVYEAGEVGAFCYLVSAYCPGPDLAAWLRGRRAPVPPRQGALLVAHLADAVEYIHGRGVLHRDIKPANVLLDPAAADGLDFTPRLTDFGLAKILAQETLKTLSGALLGTPPYMAPEQAAGQHRDVGPATDVYALGVLLYEVLAGRPPFQGRNALETLQQVLAAEPPPLRRLRPDVPRDLGTVCHQCLRKEPAKRYASAADLATDLRRFLAGEPVHARPVTTWERGWRWAWRHPAVSGLLLAVAAAVLALAAGGVEHYLQLQDYSARLAVTNADLRDAVEKEHRQSDLLRLSLYAHEVPAAETHWRSGLLDEACALLEHHRPPAGGQDVRGFEWYYLWRQWHPTGEEIRHPGGVEALALAPDDRTVAWGGASGAVVLWDRHTRRLTSLGKHKQPIWGFAFSPDSKVLASAGGYGTNRLPWEITLWDLSTGRGRSLRTGPVGEARCIRFSPDGKLLAAGGHISDGPAAIAVWDLATGGEEPRLIREHRNSITCLAFDPRGRFLFCGSSDRHLGRVGPLPDWRVTWAPQECHGEGLWCLACSPDGEVVATGGLDGVVKLHDSQSLTTFREWDLGTGPVYSLAFSPDGKTQAAGTERWPGRSQLRFWDVATGRERISWPADNGQMRGLAFSRDGQTLLTGTTGGSVRLWHLDPVLRAHQGEAWAVAFSPDGKTLASGGDDGVVRLSDPATGKERFTLWGHLALVGCVAFSPDGKLLASGGWDKKIRLWDPATGRQRACLEGHTLPVRCLAFSPNGTMLVSAAGQGSAGPRLLAELLLWDLRTGQVRASLQDLAPNGGYVAFSPDGTTLAVASDKGPVRLWDLESRRLRLLAPETESARGLAFSPDGKVLASGTASGIVYLSDVAGGRKLATLDGHGGRIRSLCFTPDGRTLASASVDRTIVLWQVTSGERLLTLEGHSGDVNAVAFSPDGRTLASASHDTTVRLWRGASDAEVAAAGREDH
jgi:WD40 repeat protein